MIGLLVLVAYVVFIVVALRPPTEPKLPSPKPRYRGFLDSE